MATIRELKIYEHFTNALIVNLNEYHVADVKGFGFSKDNESYYKSSPKFNDLEMTLHLGIDANAYKQYDELHQKLVMGDSYIRNELKLEYSVPFNAPEEFIVFQNNKIYCDVLIKELTRGERKPNGILEVKLVLEKKSAWYLEIRSNSRTQGGLGVYNGENHTGVLIDFLFQNYNPDQHPDSSLARVKRLTARFRMGTTPELKANLKSLRIEIKHVHFAPKWTYEAGVEAADFQIDSESAIQFSRSVIEFENNYVERNDNDFGHTENTIAFYYDSRKKIFIGLINTGYQQFTRSIYSYFKNENSPFFEAKTASGNQAADLQFKFTTPTSLNINWSAIHVVTTIVGELE